MAGDAVPAGGAVARGDAVKSFFTALDARLSLLPRLPIFALAAVGIIVVGVIDYLTGYEVTLALLYLAPVSMAAWYAGRGPGVLAAALSCVAMYVADFDSPSLHLHPAIAAWNSLVRLGFLLAACVLLAALRTSLRTQHRLATTDALTSLHGRRAFEDRLEHDLALARRNRSAITLVCLDLDGFKGVNDTRGHAEGDRVLCAIGRVLKASIRTTDTASRTGGDEFALVLPATDADGAQRFIVKLASELDALMRAGGWPVGCSMGVVTSLDAAFSPQAAIAAADKLMYEVKRSSKGAARFSVIGIAPGAPKAG